MGKTDITEKADIREKSYIEASMDPGESYIEASLNPGKSTETEAAIREFHYEIIRTNRRTMALEVRQDGRVIVRAPLHLAEQKIKGFVEEKQGWILKNLEKVKGKRPETEQIEKLSEAKKGVLRRKARQQLLDRTRYFASLMQVTFGKITIREQKTRWGSCSSEGNLNYNWKLILAPPEVLDYVVVHELSHRKEMNHSKAFWSEVEKVLPDYRQRRQWLKENGWKLTQM